MKKLTIALLLVLLTPAMSYAAGNYYQQGAIYTGINLVKFDDFGAGGVNGYTFQLGIDVSEYLALEGHVGMTNEVEQNLTNGTDYINTKERVSYASIIARGNLRFERTTLFGFVGMTYATENGSIDYSIGGTPGSADIDEAESSATYGIGVDLYGNKTTAITLKAVRVYKAKDDTQNDIDATMLGITHYIN